MDAVIAPAAAADRGWLEELWLQEWGGLTMVTRGRVHCLADMSALIAWEVGARVGAATFRIEGAEAELMSLNALTEGKGVGSALLAAAEEAARAAGARRLWLITSNDNLDALRFYQRRGYRLAAVYPGAVDEARLTKPTIPLQGYYDIPIHDDIELEKRL
jgi:GNAT superfamily N-acetyltransferase